MNTVNASTGFSGFQLHLGRSPCLIPPIIPSELPSDMNCNTDTVKTIIELLTNDVAEAKDNLLLAKITQAHHTDKLRPPDPEYQVGDLVMLSTANHRHEYKKCGEWSMYCKIFPSLGQSIFYYHNPL
jgi:hypothetical protein